MSEREIRPVIHREDKLNMLSDAALEAIRDATAEVIERTGIQVRSERMLKELAAVGAQVDETEGRARFPKTLQAEALAQLPLDLPCARASPASTSTERDYHYLIVKNGAWTLYGK